MLAVDEEAEDEDDDGPAAEDEADSEGIESSKPAVLSRSRRASTSDAGHHRRLREEGGRSKCQGRKFNGSAWAPSPFRKGGPPRSCARDPPWPHGWQDSTSVPRRQTSNGKVPSPGKFSVLSGMARRFRGGEKDLCPLLGHESSLGSLSVGLVALGADLLATKASSRVQSLLSICARPAMRAHCVSRIERRHQTRAPCLAYATKFADAHGGTVFSAGRGHHGPALRCSGSPKA